jgi:CRP/FNR family transcriptional regulator, cyclic AMP receptor protein
MRGGPQVDTREIAALLASVPLFSDCSKRELAVIARAAKEVSHAEGFVLAREGEQGIGMFLIVSGTAEVTIGGKPRAKLGPGDFYGEIALLDRGPRSATVVATSPIKLLGLTEWVFRGLLKEHPGIAAKMLQIVAARVRKSSKTVQV